jgi:hypothetical protein
MRSRSYEITASDDMKFMSILSNKTKEKIYIAYAVDSKPDVESIVPISISDDEISIDSSAISSDNKKLYVGVTFEPCETSEPRIVKCTFKSLFGSQLPHQPPQHPSIMQYQGWCGTCRKNS